MGADLHKPGSMLEPIPFTPRPDFVAHTRLTLALVGRSYAIPARPASNSRLFWNA